MGESTPNPARTSPPPTPDDLTDPKTTLFPKITGKTEDLIKYYKSRNRTFNLLAHEYTTPFTDSPLISFLGTVKLHGTHADIVILPSAATPTNVAEETETIRIQSRNQLSLSIEKDNFDVASFLLYRKPTILKLKEEVIETWKELNPHTSLDETQEIIIAGEYIGPGIQRHIALCSLPARYFVILNLSINGNWVPSMEPYKHISTSPSNSGICNISTGGFFGPLDLDIENPEICMQKMMDLTLEIEKRCPFAATFGIEGVGEGLVWRPVREDLAGDPKMWLKTKGPLHQVSNTSTLAPDTKKLKSKEKARLFAEAAVSEHRLEQAWAYLVEMDIPRERASIPAFVGWLCKDVEAEEGSEMKKLGIEVGPMKKEVGVVGKKWFVDRLNKGVGVGE